jgi:GTP cyclohydrolase IA
MKVAKQEGRLVIAEVSRESLPERSLRAAQEYSPQPALSLPTGASGECDEERTADPEARNHLMKPATEPTTLTSATFEDLVREMILRLGEDADREGLTATPTRVHKAMKFLTKGYREDPEALLKGALFTVNYDEMVIVKDIEVFSLCEHHMLPFFGKVHVAYIPNGRVIGLSKIPRLIELFSRRLQIQERLTTQIAETIQKVIEPQGVGVVIEARHLCMMMRGVEKQHSAAVTSSMLGCFRNEEETRSEFLSLIRQRLNGV